VNRLRTVPSYGILRGVVMTVPDSSTVERLTVNQ
jgi:hypothetical protein